MFKRSNRTPENAFLLGLLIFALVGTLFDLTFKGV